MMKLEAVELALQISYRLAVCHHLWVHAVLVLLGVGLDATFLHDKAEEHGPRDPENALLRV
jgi:hypothetical protein